MKVNNRTITGVLWAAAIAAIAYLTKGQDSAIMLIIIPLVLAGVNIALIKETK